MSNDVSIFSPARETRIKALKESALKELITDQGLFNQLLEAAAHLLSNKELHECSEASILGALYKAVTLKFRLEQEFGHCHIIKRMVTVGKNEKGYDVKKPVAVFQIGYRGWEDLVKRTGLVRYIQPHPVRSGDFFEYRYGTGKFLRHTPADNPPDVFTHFYAFTELRDGSEVFEVITLKEAEQSRRFTENQYEWIGEGKNKTKVYSETPKGLWKAHYAAMAMRVPIKRLCKTLPMSSELAMGFQLDETTSEISKVDGTIIISQPERHDTSDLESTTEITPDIQERYSTLEMELASFDENEPGYFLEYFNEFVKSEAYTLEPLRELVFAAGCRICSINRPIMDAFYKACPPILRTPEKVKAMQTAYMAKGGKNE